MNKGGIAVKFIVIDNPRFWGPILRRMFKIKKVKEDAA